jgi:hypothetical protein
MAMSPKMPHQVGRVPYSVSRTQIVWYPPSGKCGKKRAMKDTPHWMELCQQASVEQDHEKLMELINEITRLLDEKETRLRPAPPTSEDTK